MSLKHAILGFLSLQPMSGYDLKTKMFDGSVSHFWPANQAQVYRTLEQLETEGCVVAQWEMQTERPNRKEYEITEAGLVELRRWLAELRPLPKERFHFLVQLYFARHLSKDEVLAFLRDQREQHMEKLTAYQQVEMPAVDDPIMEEQLFFGQFTLDFGLRYEQMLIAWLDDVISQIEAR